MHYTTLALVVCSQAPKARIKFQYDYERSSWTNDSKTKRIMDKHTAISIISKKLFLDKKEFQNN